MKNLLNAYRTMMTNSKLWVRTLLSAATGLGLFYVAFATISTVDSLMDHHCPFFIVASILAVNIFIYYPRIEKIFGQPSAMKASEPQPVKKQTVPQPAKNQQKPAPAAEPVKEQTLADVGAEFAQEVANVSEEDLEEEVEEFC